MHTIAWLTFPTIAILVFGLIGGSAASPNTGLTKQDAAKKILSSGASKNMTGPARAFVEATARGDHRLSADANVITQKGNKVNSSKPVGGGSLPNVRVNNPAADKAGVGQTTQSETAIAISGSNVAVGYNDSAGGLLFYVAGDDLTGYSHSTDGGQTWTTAYATNFTFGPNSGCSFQQEIGAQPFVMGGVVLVAAEQFKVADPTCTGGTASLNEVVFVSRDSGATWTAGAT